MDELLGVDFAAAAKDRLYRCLDRILQHKQALCEFLVERWRTMFDASFDVLLYDLTSTYFEGSCAQIPKAQHGYSRDGRPDCRQVLIALVVTTDGLPLAYEVLPGNTSDKTTLAMFLEKIQSMYGKARRVWVMDRGIPTEAMLAKMREDQVAYLVGTPKAMLSKLEKDLLAKPWERVHAGMAVKLLERDGELYVQATSQQRQKKENVTLRMKLQSAAPGLTPRAALDSMSRIQMLEVQIPTTDGRLLILPRHTEPKSEQQMILEQLGMTLPPQPPPRIRQCEVEQAIAVDSATSL